MPPFGVDYDLSVTGAGQTVTSTFGQSFVDFVGDVCIIPPNSFALGRSVEYFRIPRNVMTITVGKSTYARCGPRRATPPCST